MKDTVSANDALYYQNGNAAIYNTDFLNCSDIDIESIDLTVTSPPYNVDIDYGSTNDNEEYSDYLAFSKQWLLKTFDLTRDSGRLCLNIPLDKNKGGQQSVCADLTRIAKDIGWQYHSTIIWNEGNISRRTAWGSWLSASAPYVIAPVEVIVVLYKTQWKKLHRGTNDIQKDEFMAWTNGLWTFNGQHKKGAGGHPAAFPIELPKRCIKLFSYVEDVVLDPYLGSGSTLLAAHKTQRKAVGVDIDADYCDIAVRRYEEVVNQ